MTSVCVPYVGHPMSWRSRLEEVGVRFTKTSVFQATCGAGMCLNPEHIQIGRMVRPKYPRGQCVYCGVPSRTQDHLWPRAWTGENQRLFVPVVPACAQCNSTLGSILEPDVVERRKFVHNRYRKKFRDLLERDFVVETAGMGHVLRTAVQKRMREREYLQARLDWPEDPDYDNRAYANLVGS